MNASNKKNYTRKEVVNMLCDILDENEAVVYELLLHYYICDMPKCENLAVWDGWMGQNLIRKVSVCEEHAHILKGSK